MTTDAGAPRAQRFDVVLRGYDRRQVDEHVTRLQRVLARMRADLELARSQPIPVVHKPAGFAGGYNGQGQHGPGSNGPGSQGPGTRGPGQQGAPGGRSRPVPRPRPVQPPAGEPADMIGTFTDRMQSILQSAEEEAAEIRRKASAAAHAESESVRAELAGLVHQRDAVLAELTRLRAQLEGLLGAPTTRITLPLRDAAPGPERPRDAGAPRPTPVLRHPGAGADGMTAAEQSPDGRADSTPVVDGARPFAPAAGPTQPDSDRDAPAGSFTDLGAPDLGAPDQAVTTPSGASPRQPARDTAPRPTPVRASLTQPPSPRTTGADGVEREGSYPREDRAQEAGTVALSSPAAATGWSDAAATGSGPAPGAVVRQAAHRMPTGAYPAVLGRPSMRPRTEPEAEPADLFRPASETAGRAAADPPMVDDRTAMVPTVSAVDDAEDSAERDSATDGDLASTPSTPPDQVPVMVKPPRPAAPSDATVLTPVVQPSAARTAKKDVPTEEPVASAGPATDEGNGAARVDPVPSSSRSG
ncbi:MAG: hypothetical protein LH603_05500 [Pseudonocardia sp.]|nr:hypothetical protein [Pseudonocardia sp.]